MLLFSLSAHKDARSLYNNPFGSLPQQISLTIETLEVLKTDMVSLMMMKHLYLRGEHPPQLQMLQPPVVLSCCDILGCTSVLSCL